MNLSSFAHQSLFEATAHLFEQLSIRLNSPTAQPIPVSSTLGASYRDREPFKSIREAFFVGTVDDDVFARQTDLFAGETNTLEAVQKRADQNDAYTGLLVFALDLSLINPARTQLAELARAFNRVSRKLPVAVVFRYQSLTGQTVLSLAAVERVRYAKGQQWRLGEKLGKVSILKDIDLNQPHSGHLRILRNLDLQRRTGKQAVTGFREFYKLWQETFSVSILNKRFYQELFHWYLWAVKTVKFPKPADESLTDEAYASVSVIRLLTRLIFVWFVKEKGLIPAKLFDENQLADLLLGVDGNPLDAGSDTDGSYYQAILQNLFFATLNTPMDADARSDAEKRQFVDPAKKGAKGYSDDYGDQTRYRYAELFRQPADALRLFAEVPFLNGGLFECLDRTANKDTGETERRYDGFTGAKTKRAVVPNTLFFGQTTLDLAGEYNENKPRQTTVKGLIGILNSYKFTIAENTPLDEEIALDPELLGRVFENLLASYNPETKSTARKQTGSFYTPREIVAYMVDESLKAYLLQKLTTPIAVTQAELGKKQTQLFGNEVKKGQLSMLETVATTPTMPEAEARPKLDALFDDAQDTNPFASDESVCTTLIDAIGAANILDPACGSGAFPMGILHRMVSLLARLDPNNRGWKQAQLRKAERDKQNAQRFEDPDLREKTLESADRRITYIQESFADNHHELDYTRKLFLIENCIYGVDIQQIAVQIAKLRFFISLIVEQRVDNSRPNRNVLSMPNLETKFVAANTLVSLEKPSGQGHVFGQQEMNTAQEKLHERRQQIFFVRRYRDKKKLQREEAELRRALQKVLVQNLFPKGTANQIADWNPFDAMHSAPFFDTETMFGADLKAGFDIVIGNPPYVRQEDIKDQKPVLQQNFDTFMGMADLLVYFYERGLKLLREGGILSYITSNKFMKANYGQKIRAYLWQYELKRLTDFGELPVFENVATFPLIAEIIKRPNPQQVWFTQIKSLTGGTLARAIEQTGSSLTREAFADGNWTLASATVNTLLDKLRQAGTPLGEYVNGEIYWGIKTGFNDAFVIDESTRLRLINEDKRSAEIIKPFAVGTDVRKYQMQGEKKYLIFTRRGIKIENYPAILKHLTTYKDELIPGGPGGRKPGPYKWFEIQDNIAYHPIFENPKIAYPEIAKESRFTFIEESKYLNNKCFIIPMDDKALLGYLNSSLAWFFLKNICSVLGDADNGGRLELRSIYMTQLPVPAFTAAAKAQIETLVNRILTAKKTNQDTTTLERQIDVLVYRIYGLTYAEVLVVEPGFGMTQAEYELVTV